MQTKINTLKLDKDYYQIVQGNRISEEGHVFTLDYIRQLLWHYEDIEEYEKCSTLIRIIKDIKDHNINYTK